MGGYSRSILRRDLDDGRCDLIVVSEDMSDHLGDPLVDDDDRNVGSLRVILKCQLNLTLLCFYGNRGRIRFGLYSHRVGKYQQSRECCEIHLCSRDQFTAVCEITRERTHWDPQGCSYSPRYPLNRRYRPKGNQ